MVLIPGWSTTTTTTTTTNWVSDLDSSRVSVIRLSRFWNRSSKVSLLLNVLNCDLFCFMYTLCHYIGACVCRAL